MQWCSNLINGKWMKVTYLDKCAWLSKPLSASEYEFHAWVSCIQILSLCHCRLWNCTHCVMTTLPTAVSMPDILKGKSL